MSKSIARFAFIPSIAWDFLICRVIRRLNKFDVVENGLMLGAFPGPSDVDDLYAMGVRAVINLCEERKGPLKQYAKLGIEQLHIPTIDFTEPSLDDIKLAVEFINQHRESESTVYVHCKSGRGRSSTVVLCWLMEAQNLSPEAAQDFLISKRGQVLKYLFKRKSVQQFWLEIRQ